MAYDRLSARQRRVDARRTRQSDSDAAIGCLEMDMGPEARNVALRELSNADRAYRAAFRELTSHGGLDPSSFEGLLASVERLQKAVRHLRDTANPSEPGGV